MRGWTVVCCCLASLAGAPAAAQPVSVVAALAPDPDDARRAVVIGRGGEVYEPDGKGAWVRRRPIATSHAIARAGRTATAVVAAGEGVVYRLEPNGWTALRLAQKGKAVMSDGAGAVAAVGRQLYALDRSAGGEPAKLARASAPVLALGAGRGPGASVVIATARGLARLTGARVQAIRGAPRAVEQLAGDRWAIVARGAHDLAANKLTPWPAGFAPAAVTAGPDGRLVAVGGTRARVEILTVHKGKVERAPIDVTPAPTGAVGVAVDRAGRVVIALRDGRVLVRERDAWTATQVREELPPPRPGAPPAASR